MHTSEKEVRRFKAELQKIGINPFVFLPEDILTFLFDKAGTTKGKIPVALAVNDGNEHPQTLLKFRGAWRLYINTVILHKSPERIGELLTIRIRFNPVTEELLPHPRLTAALQKNTEALENFNKIRPSLKKEIIKYISFLKTEESIERNIERAVLFLIGKGSFVGRQDPGLKKESLKNQQ